MNYGVILAGGRGTRMDSIDIPKQYYEIDGKPIFMYALLTMLNTNVFDLIYIAIHFDYLDKVKDYLSKFVSKENLSKIIITNGGKERIDSIHNVLKEISKNDISADDIICVHEAARPLVTERVLIDSIEGAKKYGAVVASVPAEDTILISDDGSVVDTIPDRKRIFREQAPESFRLKELIEYEKKKRKYLQVHVKLFLLIIKK